MFYKLHKENIISIDAKEEVGSLFVAVIKAWSCFFIFFFMVIELIYRIDSFLKSLSLLDIAVCASLVIFLYLSVSVLIGFLSSIVNIALKPFTNNGSIWVLLMNYSLILCAVVYKMLITALVWMNKTLSLQIEYDGVTGYLYAVYAVSLLLAMLIVGTRDKLYSTMQKSIGKAFMGVAVISIVAFIILGCKVAYFLSSDNEDENSMDTTKAVASVIVPRPNIILVSFDALTAEDMSLHGYRLQTTPNIDAFARQCYVFDNMFANSNFTSPGIASIATGKYPLTSKVYNFATVLQGHARQENLAHELRREGYRTIALFPNLPGHPNHLRMHKDFDSAPLLDLKHTLSANAIIESSVLLLEKFDIPATNWFGERSSYIARFIERMYLSFASAEQNRRQYSFQRDPSKTVTFAMEEILASPTPLFLWVHLQPPHSPYLPDDKYKYMFLKERVFDTIESQLPFSTKYYSPSEQTIIDKIRLRYDEHIASADAAFGVFLQELNKHGYVDNSIIVVTSDHGELFEKGFHEHGGSGCMYLYQPLIHIPLLIRLPGQSSAKRIVGNAEQIDIPPTILDLVGVPLPDWMEGESLKKPMLSDYISHKPKFSMNLEQCSPKRPITDGSFAVMKDGYKYIYYVRSKAGELYDIVRDPGEKNNLVFIEREKKEEFHKLIKEKLAASK